LNENPASAIGAATLIPTAPTANAAMIASTLNIFGIVIVVKLQFYLSNVGIVTMIYNDQ
jgi:hypothetical protein